MFVISRVNVNAMETMVTRATDACDHVHPSQNNFPDPRISTRIHARSPRRGRNMKAPAFVCVFSALNSATCCDRMKFVSGICRLVLSAWNRTLLDPIVVTLEWTARSLRPTRRDRGLRARADTSAEADFYYHPLLSSRVAAIVGVDRDKTRLSLCKMLETFSRDCSRELKRYTRIVDTYIHRYIRSLILYRLVKVAKFYKLPLRGAE